MTIDDTRLAALPQPPTADNSPQLKAVASWSARVYAKLIDVTIVWGAFTIIWALGMLAEAQGSDILAQALFVFSYIHGTVGWLWIIYETGATGQSIGKRIIGTTKVNKAGEALGFWHALLHETVQLVVDMPPLLLGYIWPLLDKKGQTFSDKLLSTNTLRV